MKRKVGRGEILHSDDSLAGYLSWVSLKSFALLSKSCWWRFTQTSAMVETLIISCLKLI